MIKARSAQRRLTRHVQSCVTCAAAQADRIEGRASCPEGSSLYAEWLFATRHPARGVALRAAVRPLRNLVHRVRSARLLRERRRRAAARTTVEGKR